MAVKLMLKTVKTFFRSKIGKCFISINKNDFRLDNITIAKK